MVAFGYTGKILSVNLSRREISEVSTAEHAERFVGGRGIAAKMYWDFVSPLTDALDPQNCLILMTGPLTGFPGIASSRLQICGRSPAPEPQSFSYANLGGGWGSWLKYAGFDGAAIQGSSDTPIYLLIHDGTGEIREASFLWGKTSIQTCEALKAELGQRTRVLAIGPAGEHKVSFSTLLADDGASASGGFGAVMGSKMLKAIAVIGDGKPVAANPDRLLRLSQVALKLRKGAWEGNIPVIPNRTRLRPCYGCTGCFRQSYEAEGGKQFKFHCQAADIYRRPAEKYYDGQSEVPLLAIRLCDAYGLDTAAVQPIIEWLIGCFKEGVLREGDVDLPLSKIGSAEFIEALIRKISDREGFGDLLAQGTTKAARSIGKRAEELTQYSILTRANDLRDYDPRLILTNALLYATEPRRPIQQLHETGHALIRWLGWLKGRDGAFLTTEVFRAIAERFWGGAAAADFTTYEGKALAAKKIQDRAYAKESLILCDIYFPILWVRYGEDHAGDPTLESQILSAVTGKEFSPEAVDQLGEKVFNLQRAILMREGWGGREGDRLLDHLFTEPIQYVRFDRECIVPGPDGKSGSRQGKMINREAFENLKSDYYRLRGWDITSGMQTKTKLQELGLKDIAEEMGRLDLFKEKSKRDAETSSA